MTNLPAWLNPQAPNLSETLGKNLGSSQPPYMSIEGNRLTLVDASGDKEAVTTIDPKTGVPYLDCRIVDVGDTHSQIWFKNAYDPANPSPPDCWSDNGIGPSTLCSSPQAKSCMPDPSGLSGCKLAVWGAAVSRVSGKPIPACSKQQKLAILIPGDDMLFQVRVPPNSLDNLRAYNAKFKGQNFGINAVITRISFETGVIGTLTFDVSPLMFGDQESYQQGLKAKVSKATDTLVGRGDVPIGGMSTQALPPPQQDKQPEVAFVPNPAPLPPPQQVQQPAAQQNLDVQPARRRRKTAEAAPGPVVGQPAPFRPAESSQQNGPAFGMAPGVAPDPGLQSAIDSIFK